MLWSTKRIECDGCGKLFRAGNGHNCWCKECKEIHPMCNECYIEGKALGAITDKKINIGDLDNKDRYT